MTLVYINEGLPRAKSIDLSFKVKTAKKLRSRRVGPTEVIGTLHLCRNHVGVPRQKVLAKIAVVCYNEGNVYSNISCGIWSIVSN